MHVDLPWPSRVLHPNARVHWGKRAKAAKAARLAAAWAAKAAKLGPIEADLLKVTAVFSPPDDRPRDDDGMLSNIKSYLDGIADVIGIDDSRFRTFIRREPKRPGGNVRIEIEVADTWQHISAPAGRALASIPMPKRSAA